MAEVSDGCETRDEVQLPLAPIAAAKASLFPGLVRSELPKLAVPLMSPVMMELPSLLESILMP